MKGTVIGEDTVAKVTEGEGGEALTKKAYPICGGCGSTEFKYVTSTAKGLLKLECESCGHHIVVSAPVMVRDRLGKSVQFDYNEGEVKRKKPGTPTDGYVTVSLRVPEATRDRFQYGIQLARAIAGVTEKGMYPNVAFEYMIEEFITTYEGQVNPDALAEIQAKFEAGSEPLLKDTSQEDLFEGNDPEMTDDGAATDAGEEVDPEATSEVPEPSRRDELEALNKADLADRARALGLTVNSRMPKALLVESILGIEAADDDDGDDTTE